MSGSTIGGVVGAAIGFYVGGAQGMQVGWMIGSAVGGYVDPDVIQGPKLKDAQQQTSMEGAPRAIVFGTAVVAGNVIQTGELIESKHRERTGKGGPVQETYAYSRSFAIRVCEGPIGGITRIWMDDKLVYDRRDPDDWPDQTGSLIGTVFSQIFGMAADTDKFASKIAIYLGDENQLPDPTLEALPAANGGGVGNVPAYRGTAYVVFNNLDLTSRQGTIPQFRFEVSVCGIEVPTYTSAPTWYAVAAENSKYITSPGGYEWDAPKSDIGILSGPITAVSGDRKVLFFAISSGVMSADQGVSWQNMTGLPTDTVQCGIFALDASGENGVFVIGHNGSQVSRSADGKAFTYATAAGTGNIQRMIQFRTDNFGLPSIKMMLFGYVSAWSSDLGLNWTVNPGFLFGATETAIDAALDPYDTLTVVGSANSIKQSADRGVTFTSQTSPFAGTGRLSSIQNTGGIWCVVSSAGEIATSSSATSGSWNVSSQTIVPAGDRSLHAEDGLFVLGGLNGHIWTSPDGQVWTSKTNPYTGTLNPIYSIVGPGPLFGTPLPDVPSWQVDRDGNVTGPAGTALSTCSDVLADIVTDLCGRVGVDASQLDVSQLTDDVRGFVVGQPMAAADAIRSLQQAYFFDFPEWGDYTDTATKLRGIKRGGASVFAITDDDLVESDDDEDTRAQAVEFPRKINLITADVDADYNPTKQTAERRTENVKAVGEANVELPLALRRSEAAPKADIMLKVAWMEAEGRCKRILPEDFSKYTPSDCGTYNGKRWRIEKSTSGDGTNEWEMVRDRASAYTSVATSGDALNPSTPVGTLRGPTVFAAMNLPRLRTADSVPGMYVAACGRLDGWVGADLYLSTDGGLTETLVLRMTNEAVMGVLTANCTASSEPVTVRVWPHGELDSVTAAQITARQNAFAITTSAVQEVGQFQTATATANAHEYDLTDTLRGQLGTTAAAHSSGAQFTLLDGAVYFLPLDSSLIGQTLRFRPVSIGTANANNAYYDVVFMPQFTAPEAITFYTDQAGVIYTDEVGAYYQAT